MIPYDNEIKSDSDYSSIYQTLTFKDLPSSILSKIMNAFEKYRMAHKYGWSRPWNKENLTIFKSFRWYPFEDEDIFDLVSKFLLQNISLFNERNEDFIRDLLTDRKMQGFLFFHDNLTNSTYREGVTISLGRISNKGTRYRDRMDIILESNIINQTSTQKLDLITLYIDPYLGNLKFPLPIIISNNEMKGFNFLENLQTISTQKFRNWKNTDREWHHWSQKYIYYFGKRIYAPVNTLFFSRTSLSEKNSENIDSRNI